MHEHVIIGMGGSEADPLAQPGGTPIPGYEFPAPNMAAAADAVTAKLINARNTLNLRLIVDAAPSDLGRDVEFLAQVSRHSGVSIISCSGLYKAGLGLPFYWGHMVGEDDLYDFFISELVDGVKETGIRCGCIKLGSNGDKISPEEQKVFRAAGRASATTGAPIITHTDAEGWAATDVGGAQLALLLEAGASPERIAIGHCDHAANLDYLEAICKKGAFVAYDQVGAPQVTPDWVSSDEERARRIAILVEHGHTAQLLLSHDLQLVWKHRKNIWAGLPAGSKPKDLDFIHTNFVPLLGTAGIASGAIESMLSANPLRLLAWD